MTYFTFALTFQVSLIQFLCLFPFSKLSIFLLTEREISFPILPMFGGEIRCPGNWKHQDKFDAFFVDSRIHIDNSYLSVLVKNKEEKDFQEKFDYYGVIKFYELWSFYLYWGAWKTSAAQLRFRKSLNKLNINENFLLLTQKHILCVVEAFFSSCRLFMKALSWTNFFICFSFHFTMCKYYEWVNKDRYDSVNENFVVSLFTTTKKKFNWKENFVQALSIPF